MSGQIFQCGYGAIVNEDVEVLEACLNELKCRGTIRVVEIGAHARNTARGIARWCEQHCIKLDYTGIDPIDWEKQEGYKFPGPVIIGDSAEVHVQIPEGIDLLWIDGCHCFNHVVLDTLNFEGKVAHGGFMCYHDVNPRSDETDTYQYHGPHTPEFGIAVRPALKAIYFPFGAWEIFMERVPADRLDCGTRAYRKA